MFLASTRCGLIACRHLVKGYHDNTYVSAPDIAEKYNMNVRALMPALRQMTRAGILRSRVGGKEPGFIFSKSPAEITLLDVLISLEGHNEIPCCKELIAGLKCDCSTNKECCIYSLFNGMMTQLKIKLAKISIEEHAQSLKIDCLNELD